MTGEQSFAANYDAQLEVWLDDDFTHQLVTQMERNPRVYITDFHTQIYGKVNGSHVQMLNWDDFGDIRAARISDFFAP